MADDAKVIDWLLEKSNPSVRHFTLTKLLGKSETGKEATSARTAVMKTGIVPAILKLQNKSGAWGAEKSFYTDKYCGTVWQLLILAELGADSRDPGIRKACEFVLNNSQDFQSGGFAVSASVKTGGGRHSEVIPCLTGNMAYSLVRLGLSDDARTARAIDWICDCQRADDGDSAPPAGWPWDKFEICFGRHTCFMGAVKSLKALAALPAEKRKKKIRVKTAELVEFLLLHHVHKQSRDLSKVSRPGWLKFGFPLMYQTDALEILCLLSDLGVRDKRMTEAVAALAAKRGKDGRWKLENTFNGKMLVDIETKGGPSKWVTARAMYVLNAWG